MNTLTRLSKKSVAVQKIRREHDRFEDYERTPAGKHHKNFPKVFDVSKKELFSIKSSHGLGNIQLTVGLGSDPITGRPSWLKRFSDSPCTD